MAEISPELDELSCNLIGIAIDMLERGLDVPVLLAVDCEDTYTSFEGDSPDGCYRAACERVAELKKDCARYALVYMGVVQESENDAGSDALLVEFAERGMEHAWSGYMLYRNAADGSLEVTDPLPAGEESLLFA